MIITDKEQLKQKCEPCSSIEEGEEMGTKLVIQNDKLKDLKIEKPLPKLDLTKYQNKKKS